MITHVIGTKPGYLTPTVGNPTNESLDDTPTHRAELVVNINFRVSFPLGKTSRPFYPPSLCCHCSYNSDTTNRPLSSTTRNGPMPMATAVVRIRMGKFANRAWWSPGHGRVPKILPRCFRGLADAWLFFGLFIFSLTSCRMTNCARASERERAEATKAARTAKTVLTNANDERRR